MSQNKSNVNWRLAMNMLVAPGLPHGLRLRLRHRLPYTVYPVISANISLEIVSNGGGSPPNSYEKRKNFIAAIPLKNANDIGI